MPHSQLVAISIFQIINQFHIERNIWPKTDKLGSYLWRDFFMPPIPSSSVISQMRCFIKGKRVCVRVFSNFMISAGIWVFN